MGGWLGKGYSVFIVIYLWLQNCEQWHAPEIVLQTLDHVLVDSNLCTNILHTSHAGMNTCKNW